MLLRFADGRGKKVSFDRGTMHKKCRACWTTEKDRPTKRGTVHIASIPSAVQKTKKDRPIRPVPCMRILFECRFDFFCGVGEDHRGEVVLDRFCAADKLYGAVFF